MVVNVSFDFEFYIPEPAPLLPSLKLATEPVFDKDILCVTGLLSTKCLALSTWYEPQSGSSDFLGFQLAYFLVFAGAIFTAVTRGCTAFALDLYVLGPGIVLLIY